MLTLNLNKQEIQQRIEANEASISKYTKNLIETNSNKYSRNAELFILALIEVLNYENEQLRKQLEEA